MNKLGFAIKLASQGAASAIGCNKGQWTNKVVDVREYLKLFDGLQGTDNVVTFMSFDVSGCFLTLLRSISGRAGDFLSGWIYIPNTIVATGEDIMNTYNFVRNILDKSNLNESMGEIESFFSKDFPKKTHEAVYAPSSGEEYGVRYTGYYSMKEILDSNRYQEYYSQYKAVFLLDKDGEVKIAKDQVGKFKDLTKMPIEETCVFKNPSPEEVGKLGRGAKVIFSTKKEFKSPVFFKKGEEVQLYVMRDGFETIPLEKVTIQEDGQKLSINPQSIKWMKRISSSMFEVRDSDGAQIAGAQIFVNGTNITNKGVPLPENECRLVKVKVTARNYDTFEGEKNLLNGNCKIVLSPTVQTSSPITIELSNGKFATMTLKSEYLPSDCKANYLSTDSESPLKGYGFDDAYEQRRKGHNVVLRMSSWFIWKQRILGFLGAAATAALIVIFIALNAWCDTHHFKWGLPPWEEDSTIVNDGLKEPGGTDTGQQPTPPTEGTEYLLEDAIKYLDNHKTWTRSEMEQFSDLRGLYDDMNNFNLESILNSWKEKLSESRSFQKVCESANKNVTNKWNPRQPDHNPTYNKSSDERICLTNYINWLDQNQAKDNVAAQNQDNKDQQNPVTHKPKTGGNSVQKNGGL